MVIFVESQIESKVTKEALLSTILKLSLKYQLVWFSCFWLEGKILNKKMNLTFGQVASGAKMGEIYSFYFGISATVQPTFVNDYWQSFKMRPP